MTLIAELSLGGCPGSGQRVDADKSRVLVCGACREAVGHWQQTHLRYAADEVSDSPSSFDNERFQEK